MINFQDFGIDDNQKYFSYLKKCAEIPSDVSPIIFLNLKEKYKCYRGYAENLCWHKFTYNGENFLHLPLGDWDNADWKKIFAENIPHGTTFQFIPEYLLKIWQKIFGDEIEFESDRDYWDYILDLEKIYKLEGKIFADIRRNKNYFEKNFDYEIEEITPKIFEELLHFHYREEENLKNYTDNKNFAEDDDKNFKFTLKNWDNFNFHGFVVRIDKKIVAYILNEKIDEKNLIGFFAKHDYHYKGANQFAVWYNAKINLERGFLEENIMDDVGEENLRFFKEHLQPKRMLKKYIVTYK